MDNTDLLKKTKKFIRLYRLIPKKRFGQNFVVSSKIFEQLVSYATLTQDDIVLEIGTGFGYLTNLLSKKCKKVITVEIDNILIKFLRKKFLELENIELIEGNILDISIPDFNKVVAAPPYSISSPLLFKILEKKFDSAFFIFQKEFAQRLAASVGTKDYSRLTVSVYYRATVELLDYVSKKMFYPQPDVDSKIVKIKPKDHPFQVIDEEFFFDLLRTVFSQRNKKVRNAVLPFLKKYKMNKKNALEIADSIIYSNKRVRELAPEDFGIISNNLFRIL